MILIGSNSNALVAIIEKLIIQQCLVSWIGTRPDQNKKVDYWCPERTDSNNVASFAVIFYDWNICVLY